MRRVESTKVLFCCALSLVAIAAGAKDIKFNEIQVLHSHNSFHLAPNENLLELLRSPVIPSDLLGSGLLDSIQSLEYSHASLTEQLNDCGVRSFELDVFYDPEGGLFASRAGAKLVGLNGTSDDPDWRKPGYKVFHIPDLDFETSCVTLKSCLAEILAWSKKNPDHIPITIYIEPQSLNTEEELGPEGTEFVEVLLRGSEGKPQQLASTLPITVKAFQALEAEVLDVLDNKQLITPDDFMDDSGSLKKAVIDADNWPAVSELRGRIMIVISPPFTDQLLRMYPNLKGSPFFPSAFKETVNQHTLFVLPDALNPTLTGNMSTWDEEVEVLAADIRDFVEQGYLVRGFTDSFTLEARSNYTNRSVAIAATGAHFLSTDFPGGRTPTLFESNYTVELENGAAAVCNPVTAPSTCKSTNLAEKSVSKGKKKKSNDDDNGGLEQPPPPPPGNDTEEVDVSVASSPLPVESDESSAWGPMPGWSIPFIAAVLLLGA